jgi:hypothetical protein
MVLAITLALAATLATVVRAPAAWAACTDIDVQSDEYQTTFGTQLQVAAPGVVGNDGPNGASGGVEIVVADTDKASLWSDDDNVIVNKNGSFRYTPPPDFAGIDEFWYSATPTGCGPDNSDFTTVEISVYPVAATDNYTTVKNKPLTVAGPGVLGNDHGHDETVWDWSATSTKGGTVDMSDSDGSFVYTPPANYVGADSFTYLINDSFGYGLEATGTVNVNVTATPPPPTTPSGYWMVTSAGAVHAFGQMKNWGNSGSTGVTKLEPTPSRFGYWLVTASGKVYPRGDARVIGSLANGVLRSGEIVSSMSATPTGRGYWLFTNRGRVFAKGDAKSYGDMSGVPLNGPVVGSVATPTGKGYYMVGSDGGIFSFGDAAFRGSMGGTKLNAPVRGIVPTSTNKGYWLVATDGGIFAFGDATFRGSMGGTKLNKPVVGMVRYGNGYLMVASDGGIFSFSNKPFYGSLGANPPPSPVVSAAT